MKLILIKLGPLNYHSAFIMSDVHSMETRSFNMSMIKGTNTKPEIIVRRYLHGKGLRYRLHEKKLPGKPDIVLRKYNSVVFVNGCFFHGHEGCRKFKWPAENKVFWKNKIEGNKRRDSKNIKELHKMNWKVFTLWECELTHYKADDSLSNLYNKITN